MKSQQIPKNMGKFVEVGNQILNDLHYCKFFQISSDFELFQNFESKLG
jgi:hypothetical protein